MAAYYRERFTQPPHSLAWDPALGHVPTWVLGWMPEVWESLARLCAEPDVQAVIAF